MVDAENGVLGLEWIDGKSVRNLLGSPDELYSPAEVPPNGLVTYGITQGEYAQMSCRCGYSPTLQTTSWRKSAMNSPRCTLWMSFMVT